VKLRVIPSKTYPNFLLTHPTSYQPANILAERKEQFDEVHLGKFLLPEEPKLVHHFMCLQNTAFAWMDQERGHFWEDFFPPIFPPIDILTILHKPWAQHETYQYHLAYMMKYVTLSSTRSMLGSMSHPTPLTGADGSA
jgi:hypothetical protein